MNRGPRVPQVENYRTLRSDLLGRASRPQRHSSANSTVLLTHRLPVFRRYVIRNPGLANNLLILLVPLEGLEPPRPCEQQILSLEPKGEGVIWRFLPRVHVRDTD